MTGQLKQFGSKRYINATHVRAVQNDIEFYFHAAEVMTVATVLERGMVCFINRRFEVPLTSDAFSRVARVPANSAHQRP